MSPLLDSRSHGLRPVRNPLISGALQQRGQKFLIEANGHNRAGPPPDWRPPRSRTRQLLKVVTSLSLVSPGLDLLVAHSTSVEKMLTHGSIVYETQSRSPPLPCWWSRVVRGWVTRDHQQGDWPGRRSLTGGPEQTGHQALSYGREPRHPRRVAGRPGQPS